MVQCAMRVYRAAIYSRRYGVRVIVRVRCSHSELELASLTALLPVSFIIQSCKSFGYHRLIFLSRSAFIGE